MGRDKIGKGMNGLLEREEGLIGVYLEVYFWDLGVKRMRNVGELGFGFRE